MRYPLCVLLILSLTQSLSASAQTHVGSSASAHISGNADVTSSNREWGILMQRVESDLAAGKVKQAKAAAEQALELCRTAHLSGDELNTSLNNLAVVYISELDYKSGLSLMNESYPLAVKLHGARSIQAAMALDQIGAAYKGLGNIKMADQSREKALEIFEKVLPAGDTDLAICRLNLAASKILIGDLKKAESLLSLAGKTFAHNNKEPELIESAWLQLSSAFNTGGQFVAAERAAKAAIDIINKAKPLDTIMLARANIQLANTLLNQEKYDEAAEILKRVEKNLPGEDNLDTASLHEAKSLIQVHAGNMDDAETSLKKSVAIKEKLLPPNSTQLAESLYALGSFYLANKQNKQAEPYFKRVVAIRTAALGASNPATLEAKSWLDKLNSGKPIDLLKP